MQLHFLAAADGTPLTKTFTKKNDGTIEKTSYPPKLFEVNSKSLDIADTTSLHEAIKTAADNGLALQKGELDRQLNSESRAGHTLKDKETEWILFDVDGLASISSIEEFVTSILPQPFHTASYVVQYSASHGIVDETLNAHLFFLLEKPVAPAVLKNWLRLLNLQNDILIRNLNLQRGNKSSLKWPLDVTVAGNDKYIYIAPPQCVHFTDPLSGKRIEHVIKETDKVAFSFDGLPDRQAVRKLERAKIKELRDKEDLPQISLRTSNRGGFDVLIDADPLDSWDWWEAGGYIHLNINGGDSRAYWINPRRPKYIHSFKDEPSRILRKVAPKLWDEIKDLCETEGMLIFRDELSDKFYTAFYDKSEDDYSDLLQINKKNIEDWATFHFNAEVPDPIPQYQLVFDPLSSFAVDKQSRRVNLFRPSEYMALVGDADTTVPPTIKKVIDHVMGYDEETISWFYNWFAYIFQYRTKSRCALVLHGTKGTGKGVLFNQILKPLLGESSCQSLQQRDVVSDRFNEYLQRSLLVMFDESEADEVFRDKLFHWITEPFIRLRVAYSDGKDIRSHTNFILASNKPDAAPIEVADRRFTVSPRQPKQIVLSEEDVEHKIPEELPQFARYLKGLKVDVSRATKPLNNLAKDLMREAARDSVGVFIEALEKGDICHFLDILDGSAISDRVIQAEEAIKRWGHDVNAGKPTPVSMSELNAVYRFTSQTNMPLTKFMNMLVKRGVEPPQAIEINGRRTKGIYLEWTAEPKNLQPFKDLLGGVKAASLSDDPVDRAVLKLGET